jgi:aldose 1-epimerase
VRELRLRSENIELVVLPELGGRIHRLRAFGFDVLRTPADPETHRREPFYWGSYPMLPWGGRVGTAPVVIAERTVSLPANHPDGWAIHGQAYDAPWDVIDDRTLGFHGGAHGWPWTYEAQMGFDIGPSVVRVDLALTNTDSAPMPAGLGIHPWFNGPVKLSVPAARAYDDNDLSSPEASPVAGRYDLRMPAELTVGIDSTWTDLIEHRVDFEWPDSGLRGAMAVETAGTLVIVAARLSAIPEVVAVEPQTHSPQGLRRLINGEPDALALLSPGETLRLSVNFRFER